MHKVLNHYSRNKLKVTAELSLVPFCGNPSSIDKFGGCRDRVEVSHSSSSSSASASEWRWGERVEAPSTHRTKRGETCRDVEAHIDSQKQKRTPIKKQYTGTQTRTYPCQKQERGDQRVEIRKKMNLPSCSCLHLCAAHQRNLQRGHQLNPKTEQSSFFQVCINFIIN